MSNYNKKFLDSIFNIHVKSNDRDLLQLIERQLDLCGTIFGVKPKFNISFHIFRKFQRFSENQSAVICPNWERKKTKIMSFFGLRMADVEIDCRSMSVKVEFCGDWETHKEHFLDYIFFQPIRIILEQQGYFFVHAAALGKDDSCVFLLGEQGCGKSTLSMALSQRGFRFLCDDDCFIGLKSGKLSLLPLRTKIGIKDSALKKWPQLRRSIIRKYTYGGKKRFSLKDLYVKQSDQQYSNYVILFPNYDRRKKISFVPLSQEETLTRIVNKNLTINPDARKFAGKKFLALYTLTRKARAFDLFYSDKDLGLVYPKILNMLEEIR